MFTATEATTPATELVLPHLFRSKETGKIVLFFSECKGIKLTNGTSRFPLEGELKTDWKTCFGTDTWEPLKRGESVTIISD